jgi:hypothetical protein
MLLAYVLVNAPFVESLEKIPYAAAVLSPP